MKTKTYKQTLINFLNESIQAASFCLKQKPQKGTGYEKNDVLGFPAMLLFLAVIDAVGSIIIKDKSKSFYVLNNKIFENQKLDKDAINDLYNAYRNSFFHNSLLLRGRYLINNRKSAKIFVLDEMEKKVIGINLPSLLKLCKKAVLKFKSQITENKIISVEQIKKSIENYSLATSEMKKHIDFSGTSLSGSGDPLK